MPSRACYAIGMLRNFLLFFLSFFLFSVPVMAQKAGSPIVSDVRIGAEGKANTRFVLDIDKAVPYRRFVLNNPPRLVIDLPIVTWQAPMNKGDPRGFIKAYRHGTYNTDTTRLVLDLQRPALIDTHSRLSPEQGRPWRYVFDLKPVDPITFQQALNKVTVGGGAPTTATAGVIADTAVTIQEAIPKATQTAPSVVKKPLVILDPGHGGVDPGAIAGNGLYEKKVTLAVGLEVKKLLEATGRYRVKMTRDRDIYIKLPERVAIARRAGGDVFVSLHADTIARPTVQGASVYTLSNVASDAETAKLAARENAVDNLVNVDVGDVDKDVADILLDLVTRDTMNQSRALAETVVSTFKAQGVRTLPQNPHRSAGFAVLKAPDIPSVLIEMGYLSNKQEANLLASPAHRKKIAKAVTSVIERYFNETSKMAMY